MSEICFHANKIKNIDLFSCTVSFPVLLEFFYYLLKRRICKQKQARGFLKIYIFFDLLYLKARKKNIKIKECYSLYSWPWERFCLGLLSTFLCLTSGWCARSMTSIQCCSHRGTSKMPRCKSYKQCIPRHLATILHQTIMHLAVCSFVARGT